MKYRVEIHTNISGCFKYDSHTFSDVSIHIKDYTSIICLTKLKSWLDENEGSKSGEFSFENLKCSLSKKYIHIVVEYWSYDKWQEYLSEKK